MLLCFEAANDNGADDKPHSSNHSLTLQLNGVGELTALKELSVTQCSDEVIEVLDIAGILKNLDQLSDVYFYRCVSITKLSESIGLWKGLHYLDLYGCEILQELPGSIGELQALQTLYLWKCSGLETLPDTLSAVTSLQHLWIVQCTSIIKLRTFIGCLSRLHLLRISGCSELLSLPESLSQLDALHLLMVSDCGRSLEELGALKALQGLRIGGCTSISEIPGSSLLVVNKSSDWHFDVRGDYPVRHDLKEVRVMEANDCGITRLVQGAETGQLILQRVHKLLCCKVTIMV